MTRPINYVRDVWMVAGTLLVLQACASETKNTKNPHDSQRPDAAIGKPDAAIGVPDSGIPVPEARVRINSPWHLSSMIKPDVTLDFEVGGGGKIDITEARKRIYAATTVTTWPGKLPVTGTWSTTDQGLYFKPDAPLADGEYLVRIKPDGNKLKVEREHTLFHVGPLPRVKYVRFESSGPKTGTWPPTSYDRVVFSMSEPVDPTKWTLTVESQQSGTFKTLSAVNTAGAAFQLSAPVDAALLLRITLGPDVGATSGLKLDGKYTGVAGSGSFTATFVPKDYLGPAGFWWVPDLKF